MTNAACVLAGGALGAWARYLLQGVTQSRMGSLPLGTLLVNLSGVFAMGFVMTAFHERFMTSPGWRLFIAAGVLGGFTTFSGLAWDAHQLFQQNPVHAAWYLFGSFAGGALALLAGLSLGKWV